MERLVSDIPAGKSFTFFYGAGAFLPMWCFGAAPLLLYRKRRKMGLIDDNLRVEESKVIACKPYIYVIVEGVRD
jgi:hypothetical protein